MTQINGPLTQSIIEQTGGLILSALYVFVILWILLCPEANAY